jgi:hypothetical protein
MVTGLEEARMYRSEGTPEEREGDSPSGEVFLAGEQLHPSLDEIFHQIDAAHKRGDEWIRQHFHPAHARHGAR